MHFHRNKAKSETAKANRAVWFTQMERIAAPVLKAAESGRLSQVFPEPGSRLAAAAGVLCGLSSFLKADPWDEEEKAVRQELLKGSQALLNRIIDPDSPDGCRMPSKQSEPDPMLSSNGLLAFALLKAKNTFLSPSAGEAAELAAYFHNAKKSRPRLEREDLLYSAMIELALYELEGECETQVLDYTMNTLISHSRGDGVFAPARQFQWGYAHTFFVYPMLDILTGYLPHWFSGQLNQWQSTAKQAFNRMLTIQARFLSPDGSFPPLGPELWLRGGAFHTLAHGAYLEKLPKELSYPCVREALYKMIEKTLTPEGTVDKDGFLLPGLCGHQPSLCPDGFERGRLYGCMAVFAPLGLPPRHKFWQDCAAETPWQELWQGRDIPLDRYH